MQFGGNNPINFNDPTGLASMSSAAAMHLEGEGGGKQWKSWNEMMNYYYGPNNDGVYGGSGGGGYTPTNTYSLSNNLGMTSNNSDVMNQSYVAALQASNDSVPNRQRLKEMVLGWYEEERRIDEMVKDGLWDRNLSEEQARSNTLNLGLGLVFSNVISKFITIAINPNEAPISRFGQIRGGIQKAQELEKKNHNLKLSDGKRIDIKGRHPLSKGHYNKITKEQLGYPHVYDPMYPGGVRMPNANDYIEIFKLFK